MRISCLKRTVVLLSFSFAVNGVTTNRASPSGDKVLSNWPSINPEEGVSVNDKSAWDHNLELYEKSAQNLFQNYQKVTNNGAFRLELLKYMEKEINKEEATLASFLWMRKAVQELALPNLDLIDYYRLIAKRIQQLSIERREKPLPLSVKGTEEWWIETLLIGALELEYSYIDNLDYEGNLNLIKWEVNREKLRKWLESLEDQDQEWDKQASEQKIAEMRSTLSRALVIFRSLEKKSSPAKW